MNLTKARPRRSADLQEIHRIAEDLEPQLAAAFRQAIASVRGSVDLHVLLAAVQRGDEALVQRVLRDARLPTVLQPVVDVTTQALVAAAIAHAVPMEARLGAPIAFDIINPRVVDWMRENAATLVTRISEETRDAMRSVLERAATEGAPPMEVAASLRDMIGLNERQANALYNYRVGLVEQEVDPASVETLASAYADRLLDQRAEMISRTEIVTAANEGKMELWLQAVDQGLLDREKILREWIATTGACPICEELDGQQVGMDEAFETEDGDEYDQPPAHPLCRCSLGLVT